MLMAPNKPSQQTIPKQMTELPTGVEGLLAPNSALTLLDRTRELDPVSEDCRKKGRESFLIIGSGFAQDSCGHRGCLVQSRIPLHFLSMERESSLFQVRKRPHRD